MPHMKTKPHALALTAIKICKELIKPAASNTIRRHLQL